VMLMSEWEEVLKRRGSQKRIDFQTLKQAVQEVISNKTDFRTIDILPEIKEEYAGLLMEQGDSKAVANQRSRRLEVNTIGTIISRLGTHSRVRMVKDKKGKSTNLKYWRKNDE